MRIWALLGIGLAGCAFDASGEPTGAGGDAAPTPPDADELQAGDLRLLFGDDDGLHARRFRGATRAWDGPEHAADNPGDVAWVVAAIDRTTGDEVIGVMVGADNGSELRVVRRTGQVWRVDWAATSVRSTTSRWFDVVAGAGGVVVAYGDDAGVTTRTLVDGAWGAAFTIPPPVDADDAARWVELEASADGDALALGYATTASDLVVGRWRDGTWGTVVALDFELKRNAMTGAVSNRAFDVALSDDGHLVAAWGRDGQSGFAAAVLRADADGFDPTESRPDTLAGVPHFVDLAARADGPELALGAFDLGDGVERLGTGIWHPDSGWQALGELDGQIADVEDAATGDFPGGVAWLGGEAILVYPDDVDGQLDWARWDGAAWSLEVPLAIPDKGRTESARVVPIGNGIAAALTDDSGALHLALYGNGAWTLADPPGQAAATGLVVDSTPFDLALR